MYYCVVVIAYYSLFNIGPLHGPGTLYLHRARVLERGAWNIIKPACLRLTEVNRVFIILPFS